MPSMIERRPRAPVFLSTAFSAIAVTASSLKDSSTPVSIFQRLGYVLSFIKEEELAERLKERVLSTGKKFRRTLLKTDVPEKGGEPFCPIWKIVVNISLQNDTL